MTTISTTETRLIKYSDLFDFCNNKFGTKFPPVVSTAYDEARKYKVNGSLLVLWACVRSGGFSSREYKENIDIFRLGGRYDTHRSALACGASELAKFTTTEQMQQEDQSAVEKLWDEAWAFVDSRTKPVEPPPPPPPPPKPPVEEPQPPEPVPSQPEQPPATSGGWNWKKISVWMLGIVSVAGLVAKFTPTPFDDAIVAALRIIAGLFSGG